MVDVDALSRRYGSLLAQHMQIAFIISRCDKEQYPVAYKQHFVTMPDAAKISAPSDTQSIVIPIFKISAINDPVCSLNQLVSIYPPHGDAPMLCSVPIHLHTMQGYKSIVGTLQDVDPQESDNIWQSVILQVVDWLCVDDVCVAFEDYALSNNCSSTH